MLLQQSSFKILLFLLTFLISQPNFAATQSGSYPFPLDLTQLEPLKNNPNVLSYTLHKIDSKTVIVNGKLRDGCLLKIRMGAGDAWSKICKKTIPSSKPDLNDQTYWLNQALLFAKQVWSEQDFSALKQDIEHHRFIADVTTKNKLHFAKYHEGGYESIEISQSDKETVILLQQSAC